jgi:hypothetical protein
MLGAACHVGQLFVTLSFIQSQLTAIRAALAVLEAAPQDIIK